MNGYLILASCLFAVSSYAEDPAPTLYAAHNESEISQQAVAPVVAWMRNQRFALKTGNVESLRLNMQSEPDLSIESDVDDASKARKILARVTGALNFTTNSYRRSKLYWISGDGVKRSADINIFDDRSADGTTFRKLFRVNTPTNLAGYSIATKRVISLDAAAAVEDNVRIYSPLMNRSRQAVEANRSDPLFGGALSVDDISVSSENYSSFDARVVAEKEIILPFLKPAIVKAEVAASATRSTEDEAKEKTSKESFSLQATAPKGGEFVSWNFQSRELPQFSPWVPLNIYFVPRPVWIIELLSKDPYFPHGKEYLVVDKELFLPFYKMVYDRVGDYRKTVVGSWAMIDTGGKLTKQKIPMSVFVLSVDQSTEIVNVLNTQSMELALDAKSNSMDTIEKWFKLAAPPEKKGEAPTVKTPTPVEPTPTEHKDDEQAADDEAPGAPGPVD